MFGQAGAVWYTIEGVIGNTADADGSGTFWDYQTHRRGARPELGTDAEFPTRGVQINAVVKSGGNDFHGGGLFDRTTRGCRATTSTTSWGPLASRSGNSHRHQYDLSGDLGGRIIRNKLWFYGAVRYRDIHRTVLDAYSEAPLDEDRTISSRRSTSRRNTRIRRTASHRFIFFNQWEHLRENAKMDSLRPGKSREDKKSRRIPSSRGGCGGPVRQRHRRQLPVRVCAP